MLIMLTSIYGRKKETSAKEFDPQHIVEDRAVLIKKDI
jgi:hypothetical protein